jgi:hypothetical protein
MLKDKVYVINLHSLQELKESVRQDISIIPRQQLDCVSRSIFSRCEAYIEVEGALQDSALN